MSKPESSLPKNPGRFATALINGGFASQLHIEHHRILDQQRIDADRFFSNKELFKGKKTRTS